MKYDFTTMPDRTGRDELAVDAIGADVSRAVAPFHDAWGIRMNLALPYAQVVEAFDRLKEYVFRIENEVNCPG